jgi:hypothetical protein
VPGIDRNRIKLIDFWPRAKVEDTFIAKCLEGTENFSANLVVESVFVPSILTNLGYFGRLLQTHRVSKRTKKLLDGNRESGVRNVWWTGENIRPPIHRSFDHFVSFDQDSFGGVNTYFPLFYIEALLPSTGTLERIGVRKLEAEELTLGRSNSNLNFEKQKFACAFINNPDPVRIAAIQALSRFGQVDVFGRYSGRPVKSKSEIARNYKYMICFENDIYPGYVTEKLLDAYLAGTVPLYWGDLGEEKHINRNSFLNLKDFPSLEAFAKVVASMDADQYCEIYSQPLLESVPPVEPLVEALLGTSEFKNES